MIKAPSALALLLAFSAPAIAGPQGAGYSSSSSSTTTVHSSAEREIARREESMTRAREFMEKGDKAMDEKDFETAVAQYKLAVDALPDSDMTHALRVRALHCFCDATVRLAEQRIAEGRREDARRIAQVVLRDEYDPQCHAAIVLLARLEDPDYYNTAVTPGHIANVELVKKYFIEAEDFYELGRYDLAFKRYEQILAIDPYNVAARRGEEKVDVARSNYALAARDESRSRAIWEVDKQWERPVRKYGTNRSVVIQQDKVDIRGTEYIQNKLNRIVIPKIEFSEVSIREAIDFLKQKSRELDTTESDPSKKGVNIVLKLENVGGGAVIPTGAAFPTEPAIPGLEPAAASLAAPGVAIASSAPGSAPITLSLGNVPLIEALRYITSLANLKFKVDPYAVSIVPLTEVTDTLITKEYKVPPGFIQRVPSAAAGGALGGGGFGAAPRAGDASGAGANLAGNANAQEFLASRGVVFPTGGSAYFLPSSSRLIVRNTPANLDLIDQIVEAESIGGPSQVEIESKFVEITQNNTKELGFDMTLGAFNAPGSNKVFGVGGTAGTSPALDPTAFPFVQPGGGIVGTNPVTSGNRSGNLAISANAIDALLFGGAGASAVAPGILGIGGVFTDPQFQIVIRALNQKKGVDLMSAPRVTTKSGQKAVIEIIREFRYPTEFDPPQIPQTVGATTVGGGGIGGGSSSGSFPVTPTTPTAFETRNTGVTLEVEPVVGPDGFTIDLNLVPQVVEFEGFINYGSPIQTSSVNALGVSTTTILTPNVINQPIFSTRKVTTSVSIWDGSTVVLGGLMREDVQKVEDKVPFFGDVPLLGRLFRSEVEQHLKRNLIIFVTARLINPAGELVRDDDEKEEIVEPLVPLQEQMVLQEAPVFIK